MFKLIATRFAKGFLASGIALAVNHFLPYAPTLVHTALGFLPPTVAQFLNEPSLEGAIVAAATGGLLALEKALQGSK